MGLPGGRGSPIGMWRTGDRGQAACPARTRRPARLVASTASPPDSIRAATSPPRGATIQPDGPPGLTGRTGAPVGWRQDSPTWLSVGGRWVSPAAAGASARTCGRRQDSPTCPWVGGRRASCWPPGQLPPAIGQPPTAARRASTTRQPGVGGLLSPFADALLGQHLAQPGMLVVHGSFPFLPLSPSSGGCQQRVVAGQLRMGLGRSPRIRHVPYASARLLPIFGR
jgi:hypothetical protein